MNAITSFRLCTLSDIDLIKKVDEGIDKIYQDEKIPTRHIPARPNEDFDLLVGELMLRFKKLTIESPVPVVRSAEEVSVQSILDSNEFKERFELMGSNQFLSIESYKSYLANMKLAKESFVEGLKFYANQFKGTTPNVTGYTEDNLYEAIRYGVLTAKDEVSLADRLKNFIEKHLSNTPAVTKKE